MRGVADRVVRQIRETGKPYCIEAMTYRFSGHGAADILQPYRSKDEVEEHRHRDPIGILRNRLGEICGLTDDDVKKSRNGPPAKWRPPSSSRKRARRLNPKSYGATSSQSMDRVS